MTKLNDEGQVSVHRHLCIVVGGWKFENWHLYRYRRHRSARKPDAVQWFMWDRVL